MRALLSVYDKRGLVDLARGLADLGWDLVASGRTGQALGQAGLDHLAVADLTGSPEILGGRVKTLHPKLHGGILADRSKASHRQDLEDQGIEPIDLVVANLYPFTSDPSVELIDIGGPAMVRAAAKNFEHVAVLVTPEDYPQVLEELRRSGTLSPVTRVRLARAAFAHTAAYDAAVVQWFDTGAGQDGAGQDGAGRDGAEPSDRSAASDARTDAGAGGSPVELPTTLHITLERAATLRYGENPHQRGARYRLARSSPWWDGIVQHGGRELSYLNLFDADAAWRLVHEVADDAGDRWSAVVIVKHANPCGAAVATDLGGAYRRALEGDPTSAFGGVVAIGGVVTPEVAEAVSAGPQADVIVAPGYAPEALAQLSSRRKATRLLEGPPPEPVTRQVRSMGATYLVQEPDIVEMARDTWEPVTAGRPTEDQWRDLRMAWRLCARTTSNAIVVVKDGQAVGVGAGQQSRVVAAEIAVAKAGGKAVGASGASDAFFPFPDGLEVLAAAGVGAVVQPGGSIRDDEVVQAAEREGVVMVMTGNRHFRH